MNGTDISVPKYIHIKTMLHLGWSATATMRLCRRELMTRLRSQWLLIYLLCKPVFPSGNLILHNLQVTPTGSSGSWVLLHERLLECRHTHCVSIKKFSCQSWTLPGLLSWRYTDFHIYLLTFPTFWITTQNAQWPHGHECPAISSNRCQSFFISSAPSRKTLKTWGDWQTSATAQGKQEETKDPMSEKG